MACALGSGVAPPSFRGEKICALEIDVNAACHDRADHSEGHPAHRPRRASVFKDDTRFCEGPRVSFATIWERA
jgi:hypothetical protein